jgi:hypothetical protein
MRDQARVFEDRPFHLVLFNVFERGAIRLAQAYPAWRPASPGSPPHILVVGLGRLGQNLVIHLARTWWNTRPDRGWKLEIDVIDRHAGEAIETLSIRCPQLSDAVSFTPLTLEVPSAGFERADYLRRAPVERIYICLDDDALALQAGLCLRSASAGKIPIVMRMAESGGLERLLVGSHFDNLSGFNLLESTCTPDLLDMQPRDILARAVHEEYLRGRLAAGQVPATDPSGQPWDSLDPVLRAQNYRQVDHLMDLCAEAGYTIRPLVDWDAPSAPMPDDLVEGMACREHELWVADRIAGGWRYQPGEKNLAARTNPALLPWDELSEPDREKNRVFVRGIPAFLGQVGYQLTR